MKYDNVMTYNYIARPTTKSVSSGRVTILRPPNETALTRDFEDTLRGLGLQLDICTLEMNPPARQTVISILDLEAPFFANLDEITFDAFRKFMDNIDNSGMLWITGAVQLQCQDPRYGMALGMARNLRVETGIDIATLELEHFDQQAWCSALKVLHNFEQRLNDFETDPVLEYVFANGYIQTGKFHWIDVGDQLKQPRHGSRPQKLDIGQRGALQTLYWKQYESPIPVEDQVEVDVRAVGMNFKVCDQYIYTITTRTNLHPV